jgi:hypothetical protein
VATPRLAVAITSGAGFAFFAGVRWIELVRLGNVGWPEMAWFVFPIALTYAAAVATGLLLLKDGVTRWWWVPATALVALGLPVDDWVGWSAVSTAAGAITGAAADLAAMLAPVGVAWFVVRGRRIEVRGRLIPALLVAGVVLILGFRVGVDGPDLTPSVGVALLALGLGSQSSSWRRAVAFVLIAVALGAQVPASLANALAQGRLGPVAFVDATVDIGVSLLAFGIAPLSAVSRRVLGSSARRPATVGSAG